MKRLKRKLIIMSSSERFCLRWNDFETNISKTFRDLKEENDFTDVTLACSDNHVEAHKVILATSSSFFKRILKKNSHSHPLIYLKGIKSSDVEAVLNYIYHGEVNVEEANLNAFLEVAEELEVKGLVPGKKDQDGGSHMQSSAPSSKKLFLAPRSNGQSSDQIQLSLETDQEFATLKVESEGTHPEDSFPAPAIPQVQGECDASTERGVKNDLGGYSGKLTEGENVGKFQCNLCGKISKLRSASLMHIESIHFPGSYQYKCEQCGEEFDAKRKWYLHRSSVHSSKK